MHEAIDHLRSAPWLEWGDPAWLRLLNALNPARWLLEGYAWLFAYFTSAHSRLREVLADDAQVRRGGPAAFRSGMEQVVLVGKLYGTHVLAEAYAAIQAEREPPCVFVALQQRLDALTPAARAAIVRKAIDAEQPSRWDTHPTTRERLAYADRFPDRPVHSIDRPATGLFRRWDAYLADLRGHVNAHLAEVALHNARVWW